MLNKATAGDALIDLVRVELGGHLAAALALQDQFDAILEENARNQQELRERIVTAGARIEQLEREMAQLEAETAALNAPHEAELALLQSLTRIYSEPHSDVAALLRAGSLDRALKRLSERRDARKRARALNAKLAANDRRVQADTSKQSADLAEELTLRDGLTADIAQLEEERVSQDSPRLALAQQIDATWAELEQVGGQSPETARRVAEIIERQLAQIVATTRESVWILALLAGESKDRTLLAEFGPRRYRLVWPEPSAQITQTFGPSPYWFEPPYGGHLHFHTGIDLARPAGSAVLAADDGIAAVVGKSVVNGSLVGYGNYVVVNHGNRWSSLYAHLERPLVHEGDRVRIGQPIGLEGSTGNSTGAHLHFELRIDGRPADPTPYLPPGGP